ncbi:hypothetical protein [Flagellimonas ruestringensis]|uniref:hypothetical protein n=1 Tax=Flagellimonas ruestringensis TaxID=111501 RepID=UPI0002F9588C|nr:hypothetical protein [Allomuricauda ruestringensis]
MNLVTDIRQAKAASLVDISLFSSKINRKAPWMEALAQANKAMHLSAIAYNLKKYLKFEQKRVKSGARILASVALVKSTFQLLFGPSLKYQQLNYNF